MKYKKLSEISQIIMGQSPPSASYNDLGEGIPFFQGNAEFGHKYPKKTTLYTTKPLKIAEKGDVLISVRAPVGEVNITPYKVCIGRGLAAIRPNENYLDKEYLFYWLLQNKRAIQAKGSGSTFKSITKKDLENLQIPLPPLPEQRRIAKVLSTVDAAIEATEEEIERTERLKRGLMQRLLTRGIGHEKFKDTEIGRIPEEWEVVRLEDVCEAVGGGTPSKRRLDFWNGAIPWISPKDMQTAFEIYDSQNHITKQAIEESSTKLIQPNSVLVVFRSGILARKVPIAVNRVSVAINQDLKALIPQSNIKSDFLAYCLKAYEPVILKCVKRGSTVHSIIPERFFKIKIPLPPLEEQKKIAEILGMVDERLELLRARKERLERVKRGLMNDLLTGRKRVPEGVV